MKQNKKLCPIKVGNIVTIMQGNNNNRTTYPSGHVNVTVTKILTPLSAFCSNGGYYDFQAINSIYDKNDYSYCFKFNEIIGIGTEVFIFR